MCVPGCEEAVHRALSRRGFLTGVAATTFAAPVSQAIPGVFRVLVILHKSFMSGLML